MFVVLPNYIQEESRTPRVRFYRTDLARRWQTPSTPKHLKRSQNFQRRGRKSDLLPAAHLVPRVLDLLRERVLLSELVVFWTKGLSSP